MAQPKNSLLAHVHCWLDGPPNTRTSRGLQGSIQLLIFLNVCAAIAETVEPIARELAGAFATFEQFSIAVFTLEYVLRVASCTHDARFSKPILGRLRYALTPMALVDLLAILPAYLPLLFGIDLRGLRILRLMRIFRVLKLTRYSHAMRSLGRALASRREELIVTAVALAFLLVVVSSVLYVAERDAQPEAFGSIPAAMWWGVTTLTTVGYGDVAPVTPLGKVAAAISAVLGIGFFAVPAGILGSAFVEHVRRERKCPHCGGEL